MMRRSAPVADALRWPACRPGRPGESPSGGATDGRSVAIATQGTDHAQPASRAGHAHGHARRCPPAPSRPSESGGPIALRAPEEANPHAIFEGHRMPAAQHPLKMPVAVPHRADAAGRAGDGPGVQAPGAQAMGPALARSGTRPARTQRVFFSSNLTPEAWNRSMVRPARLPERHALLARPAGQAPRHTRFPGCAVRSLRLLHSH